MLSNDLWSLHILSKTRLSIPHLLGGPGGRNFKCILQGGRKFFDTASARKLHPPTHRKNYTSLSFYTNCYRERILNTFTYFWCFLELFIGKFIPNIKNEHAQDCSCPGATFAFCSHGEKLPRQGGLPGVGQRVTRLSKLPRGNEKLM